ncbi:MAG: VOC family protein [Candidatus Pacebacteria bacterium]|nr:VOC family protein [Candidatus Paceibacterota bacterium]
MKTNIFVNLPVKDLNHSIEFFTGLGYTFNKQFTDQNATCMIVDENIFVMLVVHDFFKKLAKRGVVDNSSDVECAICISAESKEKVDEWVNKAISMGGKENIVPEMNVGDSMYGRSVNDLDGHIWEVMWMDPKMIQK